MAVLPLERDVIKFVILNSTRKHHVTKTLRKSCACHWRLQRHRACYCKRFVAEGAYVFITGQTELDDAVKEIGKTLLAFRAMSQIWQTSIGFTPRSSKSKVTWMWSLLMLALDNPSRSDRSPKNTLTKQHQCQGSTTVHCAEGTAADARGRFHHPECLNASITVSQPSACMARLKLPCDRLPALDTRPQRTPRFG